MQRNSDTSVDNLGHLLRSFTAPLMYLCRVVTLRYCMDVTVPFDPGAAGLVLIQDSPELASHLSFPFYKPIWASTESLPMMLWVSTDLANVQPPSTTTLL